MEENEVLEGVKAKNSQLTGRAQKFLDANANKMDGETHKAIQNRSLQYFDADYYIRGIITPGQTILLDTINKKVTGISNLDENKLPAFVYLALEKLRVAYGFHATETNPAAITYNNTGSVPAAILNGEIRISMDEKPILEFPASRFFNNSSTGVSHAIQGFFDCVELGALRLITPGSVILIELNTPKGLAFGTGNHFLEVRMIGASTRKR